MSAVLPLLVLSVFLSFLIAAMNSIQTSFYPGSSVTTSPTESGLVFGVFGLVEIISLPFVGFLATVFGARSMIYAGLLITGLFTILYGAAHAVARLVTQSLQHLAFLSISIVLRGAQAFGATLIDISILGILVSWFPDSIATCSGFMDAAFGVGFGIGPTIGELLYSLGGFPLPFFALGSTYIVLIPIAALCLRQPNVVGTTTNTQPQDKQIISISYSKPLAEQKDSDPKGYGARHSSIRDVLHLVFGTPSLLVLLFTEFAGSAAWGFVVPALEPYLKHQFPSSSLQEVTMTFSFYGVTFAVLVGLFGVAADRWVRPWYLVMGGTCCHALGFALIGPVPVLPVLVPHLWLTYLAMFLIGLGFAMVAAPAHAQFLKSVMEREKEGDVPLDDDGHPVVSIANGIWFTAMQLGIMTGSLGGGILLEHVCSSFMECTAYPVGLLVLVLWLQSWYICSSIKSKSI